MRRVHGFFLSISLAAAAALAQGCAPAEDEDGADDGAAAYTAADAACATSSPVGGESATEARARCLTEQANRLLDQQLAKNEDPRDRALAAFKGKLRVPAETGCFTEDIAGSALGIWQNDIDSERDVGMIAVQLKAAVEFLKYFYRDLDGYPNHLFQSVEICPNGQLGGDLALTGSRLRIGVRTGTFGRIGIHTATQIRDKWGAGEHLAGGLEALKGMRWTLLDPVGTPRTLLRTALRRIVSRLSERLGGLQGKPSATVRSELTKIVQDETSDVVGDEQKSLRQRALEKIASMTASQLTSLVKAWNAEITKADTSEGAEEGSVSMRDVLQRRDVKVNVTQRGLVNVQNYKQITVDTEFFLPRASFSRYVEAVEAKTDIAVEQHGLVNIQLNDVIDVKVQVLYGKAAQTGSLDKVLPL